MVSTQRNDSCLFLSKMFQSLPGNSKMVSERNKKRVRKTTMFQSLPGNSKMVRYMADWIETNEILSFNPFKGILKW